ncbi:MAG: class I SAM-dependent methyltransferase [Propionibacteriaceae bacterium]
MRDITGETAARFDRQMLFLERRLFPDSRAWVCTRAQGRTLEIAVGTGLNLPYYRDDVMLTAVDLEPAMLVLARQRAESLGREVVVQVADAQALPYDDASFDTVVSTFAMCGVPDVAATIGEALRVLTPGGRLLLADHVIATNTVVRWGQRVLDAITVPMSGEHWTRRPMEQVVAAGAEIIESVRTRSGAIEQIHAQRV